MVRQRVDEILAQEGAQLFEPEFQPKPIQAEAMRRLTVFERQKWALYFARWGCRQCKAKRKGHTGQGYCHTCYGMVRFRLLEIQKQWQMEHARGKREAYTLDASRRAAKSVLGELPQFDDGDVPE